jgi:phosphoglycolate phosphatase
MAFLTLPNQDKVGPISAVLFDKDGTLIDSHSYWGTIIVKRATLIANQFRLSDDTIVGLCDSMGFCNKSMRLLEKGPVALESRSVVIEKVVNFLGVTGTNVTIREINDLFDIAASQLDVEALPIIKPISNALSVMKGLFDIGLKIAIITSDTESNTRKFMQQVGFHELEILVIGRDNFPHAKKTGLPAAYAASALGVDISECLVIGDAPMDYQMALNSGALHLLVSSGQLSYDTLCRSTKYVVKDLCEINFTPTFSTT